MRIHHLNCATLCPLARPLVNGDGGLFAAGRMVCHCLLLETEAGLVLVDSGFGQDDINAPAHLGAAFRAIVRPRLDPRETARAQVEALGFSARDVRHIVVTHLDLDHAGGLPDFPEATVHVHAREHDAALAPSSPKERERYKQRHFAHGPRWATYSEFGERWFGFERVRALVGLPPEILLLPLLGHTRGHSAIAVRASEGWLLHAGDAYFSHDEIYADPARCPAGLRVFQGLIAVDDEARRANQARLRELVRAHPEVRVFSAHDPVELDGLPIED